MQNTTATQTKTISQKSARRIAQAEDALIAAYNAGEFGKVGSKTAIARVTKAMEAARS